MSPATRVGVLPPLRRPLHLFFYVFFQPIQLCFQSGISLGQIIHVRFELQFGFLLSFDCFLHLKFALSLPILDSIELLLDGINLLIFLFGQLIPTLELLFFKKIKLLLEVLEDSLVLLHFLAEVDLHFRELVHIL